MDSINIDLNDLDEDSLTDLLLAIKRHGVRTISQLNDSSIYHLTLERGIDCDEFISANDITVGIFRKSTNYRITINKKYSYYIDSDVLTVLEKLNPRLLDVVETFGDDLSLTIQTIIDDIDTISPSFALLDQHISKFNDPAYSNILKILTMVDIIQRFYYGPVPNAFGLIISKNNSAQIKRMFRKDLKLSRFTDTIDVYSDKYRTYDNIKVERQKTHILRCLKNVILRANNISQHYNKPDLMFLDICEQLSKSI